MTQKLQDKLFDLLSKSPLDWEFDEYVATHKPSGIELWIANQPYADLSINRPVKTRRVRGWWNRRMMRELIELAKGEQVMAHLEKVATRCKKCSPKP